MKKILARILLLLGCVATISQCTIDKRPVIAPATAVAEQLAADTSFVRIVAVTNEFQSVVYNNLRDAHSQQVRKKNRETVQRLLACNQQDSLIKGIKTLGFTDIRAYLVSLDKMQLAIRQLRAKGLILDKIPLDAIEQAYQMVSFKRGYVYPPIKTQNANSKAANSAGSKANNYGICEMCFMNNCDECRDYDGGSTQLEQPSNDSGSGGASCRALAAATRQSVLGQANNMLWLELAGCGGAALTAGEFACGATMVSIVGAPISPGVGAGVFCFTATTCATLVLVDYGYKIQQAEINYQTAILGCPK